MRKFEEILSDYNEAIKDTTMKEYSKDCYGYANQELRKKLQLEADELLSEDKKLAIFLHEELCRSNHTDCCSWYYEIKGIVHNWNDYTHKHYLQKAQNMLKTTNDIELIKNIVKCCSK